MAIEVTDDMPAGRCSICGKKHSYIPGVTIGWCGELFGVGFTYRFCESCARATTLDRFFEGMFAAHDLEWPPRLKKQT